MNSSSHKLELEMSDIVMNLLVGTLCSLTDVVLFNKTKTKALFDFLQYTPTWQHTYICLKNSSLKFFPKNAFRDWTFSSALKFVYHDNVNLIQNRLQNLKFGFRSHLTES